MRFSHEVMQMFHLFQMFQSMQGGGSSTAALLVKLNLSKPIAELAGLQQQTRHCRDTAAAEQSVIRPLVPPKQQAQRPSSNRKPVHHCTKAGAIDPSRDEGGFARREKCCGKGSSCT